MSQADLPRTSLTAPRLCCAVISVLRSDAPHWLKRPLRHRACLDSECTLSERDFVLSSLFRSFPWTVAVLLIALPLSAQSRDEAANRTIDLAINQHYLSTDFDTAQKLLAATIQGCESTCAPKTLARAWIYQGIVLGVGKNDKAGAKDAFISALALDPDIRLDKTLATPEVARMFEDLGGKTGSPAATEKPDANTSPLSAPPTESAATPAIPAGSSLNCNLKVAEIETRRPIPIQCRTDQDASQVHLRYRLNGDKTWVSVAMTKKGNAYVAEIPCKETENAGTLELYALGEDANGEDVATFGTKANPVKIKLVESTTQEPPSYDNTEPPARCGAKEECPPDFPGCAAKNPGGNVDWGNGCDNSSQCKAGLMCIDGTCETAPTCQLDDDCESGRCIKGICNVTAEGGATSRSYRKNWVGISFAQDLAFVGGSDLCTQSNQVDKYTTCYYRGSSTNPYMNEPYPGVNVGTGIAAATSRILLSFDHAYTPNITAGARVGFALGGGPPNGRSVTTTSGGQQDVTAKGTSFMPIHLEARLKYWFGTKPLSQKLRPFMHVGGGFAEVDAKVKMTVLDCGATACAGSVNPKSLPSVDLDAWKKLGLEFGTIGGGLVYAFQDRYGVQVDMNLMYTFPSSSVVLEPSIGFIVGL